jgi:hypothetical protein
MLHVIKIIAIALGVFLLAFGALMAWGVWAVETVLRRMFPEAFK